MKIHVLLYTLCILIQPLPLYTSESLKQCLKNVHRRYRHSSYTEESISQLQKEQIECFIQQLSKNHLRIWKKNTHDDTTEWLCPGPRCY